MEWMYIPLGYLVGSLPTAFLFGKKLTGKDIRKVGDGNMGARNAYFEIGHKIGILVFFIDALKGYALVGAANLLNVSQPILLWTGLALLAGHNFPVFLHFRGGRGESTTIGILLALVPLPGLMALLAAIISLLIWKRVILASAVGFVSLPLLGWWLGVPGLLIFYGLLLPIIVALTHFFRVHPLRRPAGTGSI